MKDREAVVNDIRHIIMYSEAIDDGLIRLIRFLKGQTVSDEAVELITQSFGEGYSYLADTVIKNARGEVNA